LIYIGFSVKNAGNGWCWMYCFYEDGRRLLTPFVVDERLTFCLGLTRIARNFLVFVRALYTLGTYFISAVTS